MGSGIAARIEQAANSKWAVVWLGICAYFNSFISPIPAETLLIPLCLAAPDKSWRYATVATILAVLGGLTGYAIGALGFAEFGLPIIEYYDAAETFDQAKEKFNDAGAQWILLATISPLPYKLVTITSGAAGMNLAVFVAASIFGRFVGYFLIAALLHRFGGMVLELAKLPIVKVSTIFVSAVAGYFLLF